MMDDPAVELFIVPFVISVRLSNFPSERFKEHVNRGNRELYTYLVSH